MTISRPFSTTSWPDAAAAALPRVGARAAPPGDSFRRRGVIDGAFVTAELAGLSLLRGRRGLGLALLCSLPLLPVLLGFLHDESGVKGALGFIETITTFYFRLVNPIVFLFVGCSAVGEE